MLVSWTVSSHAQQIDRGDMAGGGNSRPVKDMGGPSSRPVFVSGRVVLEHGSPPDELVAIERVCNGRRTPESYTDPKGYFSFQIGADLTVATSDASTSGEDLGRPGYAGTPGLRALGGVAAERRSIKTAPPMPTCAAASCASPCRDTRWPRLIWAFGR